MAIGTVKWFNNEKKYGFILVGDKEVFVHFSAILKKGYKTLKKGQVVECEIISSPRGVRAENVKELPSAYQHPKPQNGDETHFLRENFVNPP